MVKRTANFGFPGEPKLLPKTLKPYTSYSLNSLKGIIHGIIYGSTRGVAKRDTRSLDYSSCVPKPCHQTSHCKPAPQMRPRASGLRGHAEIRSYRAE